MGCAGAIVSLELVQTAVIAPRPLDEHPFSLARAEDDPLEVSEKQPFSLAGYAYGDFDLYAEVELPQGGEMDLVFRLVEPWLREDDSMPGFHGRFSLLRMSAVEAGPVYRSREQALFDEVMAGGQLLAPGIITSIHLQARGRLVRANIAGIQHPWYEARDDRGGLAIVVRGGIGLVHSFAIAVIEREPLHLWLYAGIAGGLAALALLASGVAIARLSRSLACLPLVAWLGGSFVLSRLLPEIEPSSEVWLSFTLAGMPLAMLLALGCRPRFMLLGLLAAPGIWLLALAVEGEQRLRSAEDLRLTDHFGRDSGIAPRDALFKQLHAKAKVHRLDPEKTKVFFLGGGIVFEPWLRNERRPVAYLPMQVENAVSAEMQEHIEAVVLPTEHATAQQQLLLFERFYVRDYRPKAVVFALGRGERQRGVADLRETIDALAQLARAEDFRVLLLQSELLPPSYEEMIRGQCEDRGWPLVRGLLAAEPSSRLTAELTAGLVELLR